MISKTVKFLPPYLQTKPNARFLNSTLDRLVSKADLEQFDGYIGRKYYNGTALPGGYIQENTALRADYQLEPNYIVYDDNNNVQAAISFDDILNSAAGKNGVTQDWNKLLSNNFYSWKGFVDLDKVINYQNYAWVAQGNVAYDWYWNNSVLVTNDAIGPVNSYDVTKNVNSFVITPGNEINPNLELLRGGNYVFNIAASNETGNVWIQTTPGVSDSNNTNPALDIRNVSGVTNNGVSSGQIFFTVPTIPNNQFYLSLGTYGNANDFVDLATTMTFAELQGASIVDLQADGGIDYVLSFVGRTIIFPDDSTVTGVWNITNNGGDVLLTFNRAVPTNYKVTVLSGKSFRLNSYYAQSNGNLYLVPPATTLSQKFYIQDDSNPNRIITLNVQNDSALLTAPLLESVVAAASANILLSGIQVVDGIEVEIGDRVLALGQAQSSQNGIYVVTSGAWQRSTDTGSTYSFSSNFNVQVLTGFTYANQYFSYIAPANFIFQVTPILFTELTSAPAVNVLNDIIGQQNYTSGNGIALQNGMKISFNAYAAPVPYNDPTQSWIVEGVGESISLVNASDITVLRSILLQNNPADYITINRASLDGNAWSRSNQWVPVSTILSMIAYLNAQNPILSIADPTYLSKGQRPILEFFAGLKLYGYGVTTLKPITYIDNYSLDAFNNIEGSTYYSVDGNQLNAGDTVIFNADKHLPIRSNIYQVNFIDVNNSTPILRLEPVAAATTGNISLYGLQVVDGYSVASGDRILVQAQTDLTTNGVYVASTGDWSRSTDLDQDIYFQQPFGVLVINGTTNKSQYYTYTDLNFTDIGTSYITFIGGGTAPVIILTQIESATLNNTNVLVIAGEQFAETPFVWNSTTSTWTNSVQMKTKTQQAPLFDIVDNNGISYANTSVYVNSTFFGSELLSYAEGTGTIDTIIGQPLLYGNVGNNNDIVLDNNYCTDTFNALNSANISTVTILLAGNASLYNPVTQALELYRPWQFINAELELYQNFVVTGQSTIVLNAKLLKKKGTNVFPTKIWVDGTLLSNTDYSLVERILNGQDVLTITISATVASTDLVYIKLVAADAIPGAWYDVPSSFESNPLGQTIATFTISDLKEHAIAANSNTPIPNATTSLNLNLSIYDSVPGTLLWQDTVSALPALLTADSQFDIDQSLKSAADDYVLYKQKFLNIASQIKNVANIQVKTAVDTIIQQISASIPSGSAWQLSDMLGIGGTLTTYKITNNGQTSFRITQNYNWTSANSITILVYLNGDQLFINTDYETQGSKLVLLAALTPGDVLNVYEIASTAGAYVPATPAKLGLGALYTPCIFIDDTFVTPVTMIRGHDGSLTTAYGDYRDNLLLDFEMRIFNNIKVDSQMWQDTIEYFAPQAGFWRETPYSITEQNQILQRMFYEWVARFNVTYQPSVYNVEDFSTWNWNGSTSKINNSIVQQGYWKGLFNYYYDSIRPNTTPWELLNITVKPSWWDATYGEAPYTGQNNVMWDDIRDGVVRNPSGITYSSFGPRKLGTQSVLDIIPVDGSGNLINVNTCLIANVNSLNIISDFTFGDGSPAEQAWRQSSYYPFAKLRMQIIKNPMFMCGNLWDVDNYQPNTAIEGMPFSFNGAPVSLSQVVLNSATTPKQGLLNYVLEYLTKQGIGSSAFQIALNNLQINLAYPLAGFSDVDNVTVYADQGGFQNTSSSVLIPTESYQLFLDEGVPTGTLIYSGIIITKTDAGYTVSGYDNLNPFFQVLASQTGAFTAINVGQTSYQVAKNYSSTPTDVPYNQSYSSIQQVFDFIISYGRYLTSVGLVFDIDSNNQRITWQDAGVQFVKWAYENWAVTNGQSVSLVLNPGASMIEYVPTSGTLQDLTQLPNQLLDINQSAISAQYLDVFRDTNKIEISHLNNGVFASLRANIIAFEHKLIINNSSIFNDIIYEPAQGLRQLRVRIVGQKTANWNGTLNTPGFMLTTSTVQLWAANQDYLFGSLVRFKNNNYVAMSDIIGAATFQYGQFQLITTQFTNSIIPNLSTKADDLSNAYNVEYTNFISSFISLRSNTIGYIERDWLENLGIDLNSQTNFYKGWIQEKGSINSVNAYNRSSNSTTNNITVTEEYAFKLGEYGATNRTGYTEVQLVPQFNLNPLVVAFTDTPSSNITNIMQVTTSSLYKYGNNWNTDFIPNQGQLEITTNNLVEAGPVLPDTLVSIATDRVSFLTPTDQTNLYFLSNEDLLTRENQTSILKIARNNGLFWIANDNTVAENNQWNVIKFNPAQTTIESITQVNNSSLQIFLSSDIGANISDPIIFDLNDANANIALQGAFLITDYYVAPSNTSVAVVTVQTEPGQFTISGQISYANVSTVYNVYTKQALRYNDIGSANTVSHNVLTTKPEPYLFVTNDANGWASYEYEQPYVDLVTPVPASSSSLSQAVAYDSINNLLWVGKPAANQIILKSVQNFINTNGNVQPSLNTDLNDIMVARNDTMNLGANLFSLSNGFCAATANDTYNKGQVYIISWNVTDTNALTTAEVIQVLSSNNIDSGYASCITADSTGGHLFVGSPNTNQVYCYKQYTTTPIGYGNFTPVAGEVILPGSAPDNAFSLRVVATDAINHLASQLLIADQDYTLTGNSVNFLLTLSANAVVNISQLETYYNYVSIITDPHSLTEEFGGAVCCDSTGTMLSIGAPANVGNVYVFQRVVETISSSPATANITIQNQVTNANVVQISVNNMIMSDSLYTINGQYLQFNTPLLVGSLVVIDHNRFAFGQAISGNPKVDLSFGYAVAISDNMLIIGSPNSLYSNAVSTIYGTGAMYVYSRNIPVNTSNDQYLTINGNDIADFTPYSLIDNITNSVGFDFGARMKWFSDNLLGATGSKISSYTTAEQTIFTDGTFFDANHTKFYDGIEGILQNFMVYQVLETEGAWINSANSVFQLTPVKNIQISDLNGTDLFFDGSLNNFWLGNRDSMLESLTLYNNQSMYTGWAILDQTTAKVDSSAISAAWIYDITTNTKLVDLQIVDLSSSLIPSSIEQYIDYISDFDPATYGYQIWQAAQYYTVGERVIYNGTTYQRITTGVSGVYFDTTNWEVVDSKYLYLGRDQWSLTQAGTTWFNTNQLRVIDAQLGTTNERSTFWNQWFPGTSINVYVWTVSSVPPAQFVQSAETGYLDSLDIPYIYDAPSGSYAFWVYNQTNAGAKYPVSPATLSQELMNVTQTGVPMISAIDTNTVALWNVSSYVATDDAVLHIDYVLSDGDNQLHSEFLLVANTGEKTWMNTPLYNKFIDSLSGQTTTSVLVPNVNIPVAQRYGILLNPEQTIFVNRPNALLVYYQSINQQLANVAMATINSVANLYGTTPIPNLGYSLTVPTRDVLNSLNIDNYPQNFKVLVQSDSTINNNGWSIVSKSSPASWLVIANQTYDLSTLWTYTDWVSPNYPMVVSPTYTIDNIGYLPSLALATGNTVGILNNGNGDFAIYIVSFDSNSNLQLDPVYIENGTIQFNNTLFNFTASDIGFDLEPLDQTRYFDDDPAIPIRLITAALNANILIGDLSYIADQAFFDVLKYIIYENQNLDWLFATSFVTVQYPVSTLNQNINFAINDQTIVQDFITETLPYHTRVREFNNQLDYVDTSANIAVTDFDLPAQYDVLFAESIAGTLNSLPLVRTPDGSVSTDALTLTNSTYAPWNNHFKYIIGTIDVIDGGANYTSVPQILITGGGGSNAAAVAIVDPVSKSLVSVVVTDPGFGFTSQPSAIVLNSSNSTTPAVIYPRLTNSLTRKIDASMRFDRVGYGVDTFDEEATYTVGDIIFDANSSNFYQSLVNAPSSNVANTAAWTLASAANVSVTNAFNRIQNAYTPQSNMLGKKFPQLMTGLQNDSLVVADAKYLNNYIIPSEPLVNQDDIHANDTQLNINFASIYVNNSGYDEILTKFGSKCAAFNQNVNQYWTLDLSKTTEQNELYIGTAEFTIEFFVRFTSLGVTVMNADGTTTESPSAMTIVDTRTFTDSNFSTSGIVINKTTNNELEVIVAGIPIITAGGITTNTWQYVVLQGNGDNGHLYTLNLDGILVGSYTYTTIPELTDEGLTFGADASGSNVMNGLLDEYRMTVNTLRYSQTGTIPVPEEPFSTSVFQDPYFNESYTKALYNFETLSNQAPANIILQILNGQQLIQDNSWNRKNLQILNANGFTAQSQILDSSHAFIKASSFANASIISTSTGYNIGSSDFAIEFWMNANNTSGIQTLVELTTGSQSVNTDFYNQSKFAINMNNGYLTVLSLNTSNAGYYHANYPVSSANDLIYYNGELLVPSSYSISNNLLTINNPLSGNVIVTPAQVIHQLTSLAELLPGTSYFISVERYSGQTSLYVNGSLQAFVSMTESIPSGVFQLYSAGALVSEIVNANVAGYISIASNSGEMNPYYGLMADFRLTNGSARHDLLTNYDNLSGAYTDGSSILDMSFDNQYVNIINAGGPEEQVNMKCSDTLDIQVFQGDNANANVATLAYRIFKSSTTESQIPFFNIVTNGTANTYRVPWYTLHSDAVAVTLTIGNSNVVLAGNEFTINTGNIVLASTPAANSVINIIETGNVSYYSIGETGTTTLVQDLNYGDTSIYLEDVSGYVTPQPLIRNFGYIFVNGEKIRYTYIDRVNNTLSGILRGVSGTSSANVIASGARVDSAGYNRVLPGVDPGYETWYTLGANAASNGEGLNNSNTAIAEFLLSQGTNYPSI